jgi:hypothetical protein
VAEHVPYAKVVYGLLDEVVKLFRANSGLTDNCGDVVLWATSMQVLAHAY